jgi:hypothetical protein
MRDGSAIIGTSGRWVRTGDRIVVLADEPSMDAVSEEVGFGAVPAPRDVIDPRIDPCAQFALLRLGKADPAARTAALGLLAAVKSGRLAGIYGENLQASVKLATRLQTVWWKLIPPGEDAALIVDPSAPGAAPATIVFRSTQTKTTKPGATPACLDKARLDVALLKAWTSSQLLAAGKLVRCDPLQQTSAEYEDLGPGPVANVVPPLCAPAGFRNVANLSDAAKWEDLLNFRPSAAIQAALRTRDLKLQLIETGWGEVNLDRYDIPVATLPMLGGTRATPERLLSYIRLHLNDFADTGSLSDTEFEPYDEAIDGPVWASSTPLGAVVDIDISGPDDGAVVVGEHSSDHWIFTTLTAPVISGPGTHPVSGNRMFGFTKTDDGVSFYIRGADRVCCAYMPEDKSFAEGHKLWSTVQKNIASFVNSHGGSATTPTPYSVRHNWLAVRVLHFKQLPMKV